MDRTDPTTIPAKRRRPSVGFSPFLRHLSRLPPPPPSDRTYPEDRRPEEGDTDGEGDGDEEEATVQVDFGFFDPKPSDFHGVRLLLRTYLDERPWDLSGFVDLVLEQTTVGTVVKEDAGEEGGDGVDDELFAVISALNLGRYMKHKSIKDVKDHVIRSCKDEVLKGKLGVLLGELQKDVGLLVCERFVNFPIEAVVPLYEGLFEEVGWATEDEPTKEARDSFRFKFYLLLTKIYVSKNAQVRGGGNASFTHNVAKVGKRDCDEESIIYIKPEDEIFHKLSDISFFFDLHSGDKVAPEMKNYRKMGLIMIVESQTIPAFRQELSLISQS